MNLLRPLLPFLVLFGSLTGCQSVFGDFEESPTPPPRVIDCNAREYRCTGATLERCKDDRSSWEVAEECASETDCNLKTQTCAPCSPGEFQCNGAALQQCNGGLWQTQATCASPALCDPLGETCAMQACVAGELRCSGVAELLRCAPGLDRFERVEQCGSYPLCAAALVNATGPETARCSAPACGNGEYSCEGGALLRCSTDRTGWDAVMNCGDANQCSAGEGACVACTQGECNHDVYRSCNGGSWGNEEACASAALCDPVAGCIAPECDTPGSMRCAADISSVNLELCTDDRRWKLIESCGPEALCDAEKRRCLPKGCTPLTGRCQGDTYQECDADGVSFVTVTNCAPGTCDPARNGCGAPCTSGFRCNDVHLEECVAGAWERRDTCATPELCNAGATPQCFAPLCGSYLGQSSCLEDSFRVCTPGRNDWQFSEVCISNAMCSVGLPLPPSGTPLPANERIGFGPGGCTCTPGKIYCSRKDRVLCNGDGITQTVLETCPASCVTQNEAATCN
jgi:hypothetical protein